MFRTFNKYLKFSLLLLLVACFGGKKGLLEVDNDHVIDLSDLEEVSNNLNGFWIAEDNVGGDEILWLKFDEQSNSSYWEEIPFNNEIKQTRTLPVQSCPTVVTLQIKDSTTYMEFISMGGENLEKIELLTKSKLKIGGMSYLRHEGYGFLKDQ